MEQTPGEFIEADVNEHDAIARKLATFAHHVVVDVADGFAGDEDVIPGDAFAEQHLVADQFNDLTVFHHDGIFRLDTELYCQFGVTS